MKTLTKKDLAKFILTITDKDDPNWEMLLECAFKDESDWYDEKKDALMTIYDMLAPLGFSKEELDDIERNHEL